MLAPSCTLVLSIAPGIRGSAPRKFGIGTTGSIIAVIMTFVFLLPSARTRAPIVARAIMPQEL
jgi:hypothetical protein